MQGMAEMAQDERLSLTEFLHAVDVIVHGTTVTTNAVLTYTGAKTGLLTTTGVRDALEMRRGIREEQYNNRYTNVTPLVPTTSKAACYRTSRLFGKRDSSSPYP